VRAAPFCAFIVWRERQSATTSAAASTARPPTQLSTTPTAGGCCLQYWKQQKRARCMYLSWHHPGRQRISLKQHIHNHGQSYSTANTSNVAPQRWSQQGRVHVSNLQHQQYPPSVHTSAYRVNQNVYPSRGTNHISHLTGGAAAPTTVGSTHLKTVFVVTYFLR
jgi:hypothetical protein